MTIRIVIADDHPLVLKGMEDLFRLENDFELVARCANGAETIAAVRRHKPDIVVLDIRFPGEDGLEITRKLLAEKLTARVVLYTAEINEDQLMEAISMDIGGIVLKVMDPRLLIQCIRKVNSGEQWIERRASRLSLEKLLMREAGAREIASLITPQEIAILKMMAQGLRNRQIGEKLFISEGTVKTHTHNIYQKLQIKSRVALMQYAQEKGLV